MCSVLIRWIGKVNDLFGVTFSQFGTAPLKKKQDILQKEISSATQQYQDTERKILLQFHNWRLENNLLPNYSG